MFETCVYNAKIINNCRQFNSDKQLSFKLNTLSFIIWRGPDKVALDITKGKFDCKTIQLLNYKTAITL